MNGQRVQQVETKQCKYPHLPVRIFLSFLSTNINPAGVSKTFLMCSMAMGIVFIKESLFVNNNLSY